MADSPTVYARYGDNTLYAVDAESGTQEWKFRRPVFPITAPTVVADPEGGDRVWSRVLLGTLGHHHRRQPGTESSAVNGTSTGESAEHRGTTLGRTSQMLSSRMPISLVPISGVSDWTKQSLLVETATSASSRSNWLSREEQSSMQSRTHQIKTKSDGVNVSPHLCVVLCRKRYFGDDSSVCGVFDDVRLGTREIDLDRDIARLILRQESYRLSATLPITAGGGLGCIAQRALLLTGLTVAP